MDRHLGKTKSGKNIKVVENLVGNYEIIKEEKVMETYSSLDKALKEGKRELLSSYIINSKEVEDILNSQLKIEYKYKDTKE